VDPFAAEYPGRGHLVIERDSGVVLYLGEGRAFPDPSFGPATDDPILSLPGGLAISAGSLMCERVSECGTSDLRNLQVLGGDFHGEVPHGGVARVGPWAVFAGLVVERSNQQCDPGGYNQVQLAIWPAGE
jgi:hypothetical protein